MSIRLRINVACDKCPFVSRGFAPEPGALSAYLADGRDGKWLTLSHGHVCRGCIIDRTCRIFGHVPDAHGTKWCARCHEVLR